MLPSPDIRDSKLAAARVLLDADDEIALIEAWRAIEESGWARTVIGGGTNLVVDDRGFDGAVLRYRGQAIDFDGSTVCAGAGAVLQDLVDMTIDRGLRGLETMTGIPGWVGGAIYGNAGAYGHSIQERVDRVRFFDGEQIREIDNAACEFRYRESIFKRNKTWVILSAALTLDQAHPEDLRAHATSILKIRNEKYPPTMRCAGSIFKNLVLADLPESVRAQVPATVVREGKAPSAYFLEQAGAKGKSGGVSRGADYHANLIYNTGGGTARELREVIGALKSDVREKFGWTLKKRSGLRSAQTDGSRALDHIIARTGCSPRLVSLCAPVRAARELHQRAARKRLCSGRDAKLDRAVEHQQPFLDELVVVRAQALARRNVEELDRLLVGAELLGQVDRSAAIALRIGVVVLELRVKHIGDIHGPILTAWAGRGAE